MSVQEKIKRAAALCLDMGGNPDVAFVNNVDDITCSNDLHVWVIPTSIGADCKCGAKRMRYAEAAAVLKAAVWMKAPTEQQRQANDDLHKLRALALATFNFLQAHDQGQPKSTKRILRMELNKAMRDAGYALP